MTIFLIPLVGAIFAALAAELELIVGGTILLWFLVLVVVANVITLLHMTRHLLKWSTGSGEGRAHARLLPNYSWPSIWSCFTVIVMALAVSWPLQALRAPSIGYDGYAIWTLHSLFIFGGHTTFLSDLTNPEYAFSNPNYPPLVPASSALSFVINGGVNLRVAVDVTAVLNASALASVGCAIVAVVGNRAHNLARIVGISAAATICLIGFGLSGPSGVGGYADLLWAAAAVAAVIMGLFMPISHQNFFAASVCTIVASLTKPEGFITALIVLGLISIRYIPARSAGRHSVRMNQPHWRRFTAGFGWLTWARRAGLAFIIALPGLMWYASIAYYGIGSDFVGSSSESLGERFHPTIMAVWAYLHVLPFAAIVAIAGGLVLSRTRRRMTVGNDGWLWIVVAGSLAALVVTYVFGALDIHWWLAQSTNRTTIFPQLALYSDLAVWLVIVASAKRMEVAGDAEQAERASLARTGDAPSIGITDFVDRPSAV
jgi:hypothetical protein